MTSLRARTTRYTCNEFEFEGLVDARVDEAFRNYFAMHGMVDFGHLGSQKGYFFNNTGAISLEAEITPNGRDRGSMKLYTGVLESSCFVDCLKQFAPGLREVKNRTRIGVHPEGVLLDDEVDESGYVCESFIVSENVDRGLYDRMTAHFKSEGLVAYGNSRVTSTVHHFSRRGALAIDVTFPIINLKGRNTPGFIRMHTAIPKNSTLIRELFETFPGLVSIDNRKER